MRHRLKETDRQFVDLSHHGIAKIVLYICRDVRHRESLQIGKQHADPLPGGRPIGRLREPPGPVWLLVDEFIGFSFMPVPPLKAGFQLSHDIPCS